jgi:CRP/FNR family transcriptional regulator, anaerobic regulatory protein
MAHPPLTVSERERLLQAYPVLRTLPAALRGRIDQSADVQRIPAGHRLFDDGDACTHHPWLVEGSLRVSKRGPDGDEILLYHVTTGGACALTVMALLGEASHAATGTVETDALLYTIPRDVFVALVLESAAFRVFVFSALTHRMSDLMALVDDVAFRGVAQRLAARLLHHVRPVEATHQMLADELGTRREVVSRILETFQRAGLIRLGRKRIEILDAPALGGLHRVQGG